MNPALSMVNWMVRAGRRLIRAAALDRARKSGLQVGAGTRFVGSQDFGTEPFLISIGAQCLVTDGVQFVNHDGAIQVPLIAGGKSIDQVYGRQSVFGRIQVGDNCFLGQGALLLMGTQIGDDSIVAARSVVKGVFPPRSVIAGTPARVIMGLDEYLAKNQARILSLEGLAPTERATRIAGGLDRQDAGGG